MKATGDVPQPRRADGWTQRQLDRFRAWLKQPTDIRRLFDDSWEYLQRPHGWAAALTGKTLRQWDRVRPWLIERTDIRRLFDMCWEYLQRPHGWAVVLFILFLAPNVAYLLYLAVVPPLASLAGAIDSSEEGSKAARDFLLAVTALVTAPFFVWRVIAIYHQAVTARETHLTTQFTNAVQQLGAVRGEETETTRTRDPSGIGIGPSLDAAGDETEGTLESVSPEVSKQRKLFLPAMEHRVGAIHALERMADDSKRDRNRILETLIAYVRSRSYDFGRGRDHRKKPANVHDELGNDLLTALRVATDILNAMSEETKKDEKESQDVEFGQEAWHFPKDHLFSSRARLSGLSFFDVMAYRPDFSAMRLDRLHLENAVMPAADFREFIGKRVSFSSVALANACFDRVRLRSPSFSSSNFRESSFVSSKLADFRATDCNFPSTIMPHARIIDATLISCVFAHAKLSASDWLGTIRMADCSFGAADLTYCTLTNVDFGDSDLTDTDFRNARIDGADLSRSNVREDQVEEAWGDYRTKLPSGCAVPTNTRWLTKDGVRAQWETLWQRETEGLRRTG